MADTSPTWADGMPPEKVIVGGYQFEPYVEETGGVSPAFVHFLNENQSKFEFQFLEIPARRRYQLMADGKIDMILFEMMIWGWEDRAELVEVTQPVLSGREILVARSGNEAAGIEVFDHLEAKRLALTLGYHYGFANFNSDPDYLKQHFNVVFVDYQRHAIRHLLVGAADLAVINEALLERECRDDPSLRKQLIISPKADQVYDLPLMTRIGGAISRSDAVKILDELKASGKLKAFFDAEGLSKFLKY